MSRIPTDEHAAARRGRCGRDNVEAPSRRSWLAAVALGAVGVIVAAGCATGEDAASGPADAPSPEPTAADIHELKMFTSPSALSLSEDRGVDGFAANLYAVRRDSHRAVAIDSGTLEILLFDGVVRSREVLTREPRQTWTFPHDRLAGLRFDSAIGVGYGLTLHWDKNKAFEHGEVTAVARYLPPAEGARPVYSAPVSLALKAK